MASLYALPTLAVCLNRGMALEDNWHAHLMQLIEAEGNGNARAGYRALAQAIGMSEEYVYQLAKKVPKADGTPRAVSFDVKRKIARAYARGRNETWIDLPVDGHPSVPPAPALADALPVVLDAMAAAKDREALREMLLVLVRNDSPEARVLLARLLAVADPDPAPAPAKMTKEQALALVRGAKVESADIRPAPQKK